ncbi:hypothetical protein TNCV_3216801 [Trichonephila clavipes]|nr:hypothetical protein TNCV_3216801 [Trichonephila clavipes]
MHVAMGSLFIVWPRNRVDPLTGSHNGLGGVHRVTRGEACLSNESDALDIYERIDLRNKRAVTIFRTLPTHDVTTPFFKEGTDKLVSRYGKCLNNGGNHIEN